jgi:hypothetical protein
MELKRVGDFCERAAPIYKPQGPVVPVGKVKGHKALTTTVIRQIAQVCHKHFSTPMYSTVTTLARASLGQADIDDKTVRASLRPWRKL